MSARVRVDWPACRARGLCHELLPEVIELDEWGYPIVVDGLRPDQVADARAAAEACPRLALKVVRE